MGIPSLCEQMAPREVEDKDTKSHYPEIFPLVLSSSHKLRRATVGPSLVGLGKHPHPLPLRGKYSPETRYTLGAPAQRLTTEGSQEMFIK